MKYDRGKLIFVVIVLILFGTLFQIMRISRLTSCYPYSHPCLHPGDLVADPMEYLNQEIQVRGKIVFVEDWKEGNYFYYKHRMEDIRLLNRDSILIIRRFSVKADLGEGYGGALGIWEQNSKFGYYLNAFSVFGDLHD